MRYSETVPIEYILYGQFIKYEDLSKLVNKELSNNSNDDYVRIYIDAYQMLLPLYKFLKVSNPLNVVSCLINMAIHYKYFFLNSYGVKSNVFIIYSPTMSSTNTKYCPDYNIMYTNRILNNNTIRNIIDNSISLMHTITPYIPGIYFKTGSVEVPVIIYDMERRFISKGYANPALVISDSQYAFQLPSKLTNIYILSKKQSREGDIPYSVNNKDSLNMYVSMSRKREYEELNIDPSLLSGFMILNGIPKRNVKTLFNYKESISILNYLKNNYKVLVPDAICEAILELFGNNKISLDSIQNRYRCIELDYQLSLYKTLPESTQITYLKDLQDPIEVKHINEKYFKSNPLNLERLV